jgi:hypothetical protein
MPVQKASRSRGLIIKVVLAGTVSALLSLAANFLTSIIFTTSPLPKAIRPYVPYIFPSFGVLLFASILIAIFQESPLSTKTGANGANSNIGFPCPSCRQSWMYVHGGKNGRVSFQCGYCGQPAVATYHEGTLVKLFVAGIGAVVGAEAITHLLNSDPDTVASTFESAYDYFFGQ